MRLFSKSPAATVTDVSAQSIFVCMRERECISLQGDSNTTMGTGKLFEYLSLCI